MKFRKWFAGWFWYGKDGGQHQADHEDADSNRRNSGIDDFRRNRVNVDPIPGSRNGFSVPVQVPVERPVVGPILVPCNGDGGVQGLRWYDKRLKIDEDGDVADEFLHEILPETSPDEEESLPRFQANKNTEHARVRDQVFTQDGKLQHRVEYQGKLHWV